MQASMNLSRNTFLGLLIFFNAIPIYGVLIWQWNSFDIIFLYWFENIIIGLFTVIRFIVRPFSHPVELIFPLFMAPFFTFHYGAFCYGHGTFLINMFGKDALGEMAKLGIPDVILPVIETRQLFWPIAALFAFQLLDWVRDTMERGLGSDNIKVLMIAPYRRIIVLHITIIASGFALAAIDQPTIGLLLLIAFKTGFDIYHWDKDEKAVEERIHPVIDEKTKNKLDEFIDNPKITINGKEIQYNSFEELKASRHYGLLQATFRMIGGNNKLKEIENYIENRIKEKQDPYSR